MAVGVVSEVDAARDDPSLVVLEGFHAVKHALQFGAELSLLVTPDHDALRALAEELAPDVAGALAEQARPVDAATWRRLAPRGLPSPALAVATRPSRIPAEVGAPLVLLDRPRHLGNLGACVRVAAAAGAAGVVTTGTVDPWHATVVRAAAGLHFAVDVRHLDELDLAAPIVAVDPDGDPLGSSALPESPVFAFGSERHGLADDLLARATQRVRIPMRPGVSSLNLATAVAVVLYAHRGIVGRTPGTTLDRPGVRGGP